MKLTDGRITILASDEGVEIELHDKDASITFAKVKFTPEQFAQALSRLAYTECKIEVYGLDKVGTKMKYESFEFEFPIGAQREEAKRLVKEQCPEGWEPALYFNSQDSFFWRGDKQYARTTIRKWIVEKFRRISGPRS